MPSRDYYLPGRRLVSQEDAATIESARVPRSKFVGSWTRKTSFNAGWLVPFMVDEVLPGDHMTYNVTAYVRMATPLFPIFDNQRIDTFFFFVPSRILWTNWVRFMGEQVALTDEPEDFLIPIIDFADAYSHDTGTLYDHMGVAAAVLMDEPQTINALPFRAYNQIYIHWFRDQNLIPKTNLATTADGPDASTMYVLRRRAKAHDYFTSALPWPQKFTAPTIPMGGLAPVQGIGIPADAVFVDDAGPFNETLRAAITYDRSRPFRSDAGIATAYASMELDPASGTPIPAIYADLSEATGIAINTFRQAFLVNQLLERDARGGTRYVEVIRSHFGVVNPDFRLQRPEYIGGGQTPLIITPVAQTAPSFEPGSESVVGALGGAGTAAGQHRASYAATEHGYIIALINVRSELSYQLGSSLHRMWTRRTRYDFYWPSLAQLGEQAILRKEIFWRPDMTPAANDDIVFGYQERWHEYRTRYSEVTGAMRSFAGDGLDAWHLAQWFSVADAAPVLNQAFIEDNPPMARVLAHGDLPETEQDYLADILIQRVAVRPIPTFGTPATLGRF